MRKIILSFLTIVILNEFAISQSDPNFLDEPALTGTIEIKYNGAAATSFEYKGKDSIGYLITAKHVFKKKYRRLINKGEYIFFDSLVNKNGDNVDMSIFYAGKWTKIDATVFFDTIEADSGIDIAILKTNIPMKENHYNFGMTGIIISQECFFIGFPLGLRVDYSKSKVNSFGNYPMPFVRKGIISAFGGAEKDVLDKFYVDGHNTYGFSGAPLIYYNYSKKAFYVAGVVSSYIPQVNSIYDKNGSVNSAEENSGLMLVFNINYALIILQKLKAL